MATATAGAMQAENTSDSGSNTSGDKSEDTSSGESVVRDPSSEEDDEEIDPEKRKILSLLPPHPDNKPAMFVTSKKGSRRKEMLEAMAEKYYASNAVLVWLSWISLTIRTCFSAGLQDFQASVFP